MAAGAVSGVATGGRALPPPSGAIHKVRLTDRTYADAYELGELRRRYLELRPTVRDEQRMIAYLRLELGMTRMEVARVLALTPRTVKDYLHRWRALARRGTGVPPSETGPTNGAAGPSPLA